MCIYVKKYIRTYVYIYIHIIRCAPFFAPTHLGFEVLTEAGPRGGSAASASDRSDAVGLAAAADEGATAGGDLIW